MKKHIIGAVFALALLSSPSLSQATGLTSSQVQAILSLLSSFGADSQTISNVQTALNGGTPSTGGTVFCYNFTNDLTVGSSGADVTALNKALAFSGIDTSGNTASFTENTAGYVVSFQAKYGIRQTGYVGPLTRAKLNALYGCGVSQPPPVTDAGAEPIITSGSLADNGSTVIVNGSNFTSGGNPTVKFYDAAGTNVGNVYFVNMRSTLPGKLFFSLGALTAADGSSVILPAGVYTVRVETSLGTSNSATISIVGLTVPTASMKMLTPSGGEWLVPSGVSYEVSSTYDGTSAVGYALYKSGSRLGYISGPSVAHSVKKAFTRWIIGNYSTDIAGTNVQTAPAGCDYTVVLYTLDNPNINQSGTFCIDQGSIRVTSPTGGGTYKPGDVIRIAWTPSTTGIQNIGFVPTNGSSGAYMVWGAKVNGDPVITSGFYDYTVQKGFIPSGSYYVKIGLPNAGDSFAATSPVPVTIANTITQYFGTTDGQANSISIASGGSVPLKWEVTSADTCMASAAPANAAWVGSVPVGTGARTITNLTTSTTFYLTCSNSLGSVNSALSVTVPSTVASSGLTSSQIQGIISLLGSFGANSTTIAAVQGVLQGKDVPSTVAPSGLSSSQIEAVTSLMLSFGANSTAVANVRSVLVGTNSAATGLKIALSSTSPNGTILFQGQSSADLGDFLFTNPTSAPILVTNLTFNRIGASSDSALSNVRLYTGNTSIAGPTSVSAGSFSFMVGNGIFTVPAGGTYTASIKADIANGTAGQQIGINLSSITVTGSIDPSNTFPISSGYQTVSSQAQQ